ncbi:MAG TPA: lipoprotein insertase outer membrane protein LolB [Thiobacillaceae bacterium]|nr:lipoprotein insertase outer membrane protein LolB [Thiobacillaceae bacterium]
MPTAHNGEALSLSGRVAVHQEEKDFSGLFQWVSRDGVDDILLSDPLGQGVAKIVRTGRETTLQLPDGRTRSAPDADALTEKLLGFSLPLGGMSYWITARPDPGRPHQLTRDGKGRVERIAQDGWKIDYLSYADGRPRKLFITRPDLEIKLVVDHWGREPLK